MGWLLILAIALIALGYLLWNVPTRESTPELDSSYENQSDYTKAQKLADEAELMKENITEVLVEEDKDIHLEPE
jgi:hypothetical protein